MLTFKSYLVTQQMQTQDELPWDIQEPCDIEKKAENLEGSQNHRTARVGGDLKRIILPNPSWERELGWDYLALCPITSWQLQGRFPWTSIVLPHEWGSLPCSRGDQAWWHSLLCSLLALLPLEQKQGELVSAEVAVGNMPYRIQTKDSFLREPWKPQYSAEGSLR